MSLIELVSIPVVVGVVLYLINNYVPIHANIKRIILPAENNKSNAITKHNLNAILYSPKRCSPFFILRED
jgi:hypothetical protein